MKKRILITGGSGFIGKNIIEKLDDEYKLCYPSHKELDLLNDTSVSSFFSKNKIDVIIHCAMVGGSRKEEYVENAFYQNMRMFLNILKDRDRFEKCINIGSGAEYDKSRSIVKVREKDFGKNIPKDEYGFYKYIISKLIENDDKFLSLRVFGLFGRYEDYKLRFISNAIYRNLNKLPITIKQNVYFDYVYIDDFVKIINFFIENRANEKFYNIGRGEIISLVNIANIINKISDYKSKIIIDKKGLNSEYSCDNTRLMRELGKFKFSDFNQSIQQLYSWYRTNFKIFKN